MALTNNNFKDMYNEGLIQFRQDIVILRVEYKSVCEAIEKAKVELKTDTERQRAARDKYLNSLESEKESYEQLFEVYKYQYTEMLRDLIGTIGESKLADYMV